MQIQRVNRTDAEKVFIVVKNVDGTGPLTTGFGVRMVGGAVGEVASTDGVNAVLLSAATPLFSGVAAQDIAINDYGRVQAWGYCGSVAYSPSTNITVGPGGFLIPGAAGYAFTSTGTAQALSTYASKFVMSLTTVNVSGGVPYGAGYVRCL